MNLIVPAMAGLALALSGPAMAADGARAPARGRKPAVQTVKLPVPQPSQAAVQVADWVAGAKDNHGLPYIIVDKVNAAAFLFDAGGKPLAAAPVLIGIAPGDEATPGVGAKSLAEIGPAEKTTPAGRFLARFGLAAGRQRVLWVDYETSVALHMIPPGNPREKRRQRMLSPDIADNRITFGCINVPKSFYGRIAPLFGKKGGYVYVLPDTKPIEAIFPRLRVQPFLKAAVQDG